MVYYSALHWAKKAEASAKLAADLAQTEGKVIQLGFDGFMQDGQLVFKHAPGGVEVPYHLVDDVEYELDLAYNGDLDSLTTMVVKNGADTITFVSALHRSSTEPARVADMDAVMRYDTTTGYRWLFKATFKIAPNGAKVFLLYPVVAAKDYSDKTNCITEIPQNIKLELNNGILTLKAGSKVYVPNGSGTYNTITISSDMTLARNSSAKYFSFLKNNGATSDTMPLKYCYSGASAPTVTHTYAMWYDTTNNKVKWTNNNGSTWTEGYSLPIAIISNDTPGAQTATSIDQVFNGFGYIGSTVYALPGVKGLMPNGRNTDGSLKNIEFTLSGVKLLDCSNRTNMTDALFLYNDLTLFRTEYKDYLVSESQPTINPSFRIFWYNTEINIIKEYLSGSTTGRTAIFLGTYNVDSNGKITSFTPKQAFRAVDYNDIQNISTATTTITYWDE